MIAEDPGDVGVVQRTTADDVAGSAMTSCGIEGAAEGTGGLGGVGGEGGLGDVTVRVAEVELVAMRLVSDTTALRRSALSDEDVLGTINVVSSAVALPVTSAQVAPPLVLDCHR